MKTVNFGKLVVSLGLAIFSCSAYGGADTHGGAVIRRDGKFLTFGQTDAFRVEVSPVTEILPEAVMLVQTLRKLPISNMVREEMLADIIPTEYRRYYRVARVSDQDTARLLQNFKALQPNLPENSDLTVAAYTDPTTRETYLLPAFDGLEDDISKQAILLHEAIWAQAQRRAERFSSLSSSEDSWFSQLSQSLSYEKTVNTEVSFEKLLRCKSRCMGEHVRFFEALNQISNYSVAYDIEKVVGSLRLLSDVEQGLIDITFFRTELLPHLMRTENDYYHLSRDSVFDLYTKFPQSPYLSRLNTNAGSSSLNVKLTKEITRLNRSFQKTVEEFYYGGRRPLAGQVQFWMETDSKTGEIRLPQGWTYGPVGRDLVPKGLPMIVNSKECLRSKTLTPKCHAGWVSVEVD